MNASTATDPAIHEILRQRRSPYAFDPSRSISASDLRALFEAARWIMSSYNAQPWRYIVGTRDHSPDVWQKVFETLVDGNKPWARNAPVLALGIVEHNFEHNGKPNKAAVHDLGAASAGLTFEATARGLVVHQMIGIEPDKARQIFALPDSMEAFTGLAIGYRGEPSQVGEEYARRDARQRERKPLDKIIIRSAL
jgi:nitroreductase